MATKGQDTTNKLFFSTLKRPFARKHRDIASPRLSAGADRPDGQSRKLCALY